MLGGSLTRYHTPVMTGRGVGQDMIKLATPSIVESVKHGLDMYARGASPREALEGSRNTLERGLKRKLPQMATVAAKRKLQTAYKNKRQRVKDILGLS